MTSIDDDKTHPIVVLGSTGQTGGAVASVLEREGRNVRRASRRSDWRFDWYDISTWEPTFAGAKSAYIVLPEDRVNLIQFRDFIINQGVENVAVITARNPHVSGDGIADTAEEVFSSSTLRYTFIRPSWFTQNFIHGVFSAQLDRGDELRLPVGDGKEPFVDYRDVAEIAAMTLTAADLGETIIEISGPELLNFEEAVEVIGRRTNRNLRFTPIELDQWQREAAEIGIPPNFVSALSNLFTAIANHRDEYLSRGTMIAERNMQIRTFQQTINETYPPSS